MKAEEIRVSFGTSTSETEQTVILLLHPPPASPAAASWALKKPAALSARSVKLWSRMAPSQRFHRTWLPRISNSIREMGLSSPVRR
jgi:hypothetical protein